MTLLSFGGARLGGFFVTMCFFKIRAVRAYHWQRFFLDDYDYFESSLFLNGLIRNLQKNIHYYSLQPLGPCATHYRQRSEQNADSNSFSSG